MNITKTDPVTCASLIVAKKKAIDHEMVLRRGFTETTMPPMSEDLEVLSGLVDLSEVFVLSNFVGRCDMEIAAHLIGGCANGRQVQTIIVQSADEQHKLDADLTTIEAIRGCCVKFHTIVLDETDPDQSPLLIFGIMEAESGYLYSPDYAVDIVNAAQAKARAGKATEATRAVQTNANSVFRSVWQVA